MRDFDSTDTVTQQKLIQLLKDSSPSGTKLVKLYGFASLNDKRYVVFAVVIYPNMGIDKSAAKWGRLESGANLMVLSEGDSTDNTKFYSQKLNDDMEYFQPNTQLAPYGQLVWKYPVMKMTASIDHKEQHFILAFTGKPNDLSDRYGVESWIDLNIFRTTDFKNVLKARLQYDNYTSVTYARELNSAFSSLKFGERHRPLRNPPVPGERDSSKLFYGDFEHDGTLDVLLWKRTYQDKSNWELKSEDYKIYKLTDDSEFIEDSVATAKVQQIIKENDLTWDSGFPNNGTCNK
ncbi:MAG: hypothetical protein ACRETO_06315 [Gammaproteobacteria bacterium]